MSMRKHIYFQSKEAFDYVNSQRNGSGYIEELVLRDIQQGRTKFVTIDEVKELIKEISVSPNQHIDNSISDSIEDILSQL